MAMAGSGRYYASSRRSRQTGPSANGPRALVFIFSSAVLAGVLPVVLVGTVPNEGRSSGWIITLGLFVWAGLRLGWVISRGTPRLFEFVFMLFVYLFLGLAPTYQLRTNLLPAQAGFIDPSIDVTTALVAAVGVGAFEVGMFIYRLSGGPARAPELKTIEVSGPKAAFLTVVSLAATLYLIAAVGLTALFTSRSDAVAARSDALTSGELQSIVGAVGIWGLLIGIQALTWFRRGAKAAGRKAGFALLVFVAIVALVIYKNPISSARYAFGVVAFSLLALAGVFKTAARTRTAMIVVTGALFFVFPIADAFRRTTVNVSRSGFFEEYASGDYDSFAQIANAVTYVDDRGVDLFHQLLGVVLFWVPRGIWPGKPVDTGIMLAEYRGLSFTNLSAPLWAEFFINGGFPLVVIGFILFGYLLAMMDTRLASAFSVGGVWAVVGAALPFYTLLVLRGSLLQATSGLVVLIVAAWFVRKKQVPLPEPSGRPALVYRR